jgi:predicted phage-related endonuclease
MRNQKTKEEKLWDYLSKKIGSTKIAKEVFNRVSKEMKTRKHDITINYIVNDKPLKGSLIVAKQLNKELDKIRIRK